MHDIILFFQNNWGTFLVKVWEHLYISLIAGILGIIVAVPLGIALTRFKRGAGFIMGILSVIQTFPSFAILAFFIPLLGVGKIPAIVALFFYSVLPILRNTYTGVRGVDPNLLEAGKGMGMTVMERVWHVELPLAVPVIMAGIRLSIVYLIGWATLASFIGAGGLGDYIFSGLDNYQPELILVGAIPVTIIALLIDLLLGRIEIGVTPKAIREINEA
ncbi:ABC transporter permease [Aciduricibacillus chroicocephali]|uniref:ABC transporter permease n=1 Tax=Aciduricibacillus chroicocephali TaxID=3054939 RepID=A0ABY9KSN6_9BACI|nr:ABC transporter permease [Bacillaceae bacterium 44XB]